VTDFRKDVPPALLAVLTKMMRKNPADRYQSPLEVAEALAEWAEQPVPAPPDYEMPDLCPAVIALTGHSMDKPRGSGPISGSGAVRFVLPRSNGSSKVTSKAKASSGVGLASATGSSAVSFRQGVVEQGSTIPNAAAVSPTAPIPKTPAPKNLIPASTPILDFGRASDPDPGPLPAVPKPIPAVRITPLPPAATPPRGPLWVIVGILAGALAVLCVLLAIGR
jgi:hypothetical protein